MATPFLSMFKLCISQNKEISFILSAIRIRKFSFAVARVSPKAGIVEVSICVCVLLSLSLVKGSHVCPPFRRALYFSSREYFSIARSVSFSIYVRGIFDESILSRFSLISFHSQRFAQMLHKCPASLNEFLF